MQVNVAVKHPAPLTYGGAQAARVGVEAQLRRSVSSCLLWESEFYEDGEAIADRIVSLASQVKPEVLAALAIEVRHKMHLRHVPLLLLSVLAKTGSGSALVSQTIAATISRADELAEFVAVYAKVNGVTPDKVKPKLSAQVKKGLALAFRKFDTHQIAKYNRDKAVKLRDVLFLCHPSPVDEYQANAWKALAMGILAAPDTWEVALSAGKDKKATFERLICEGQLGYMALLRNLRGCVEAGVDLALLRKAILARGHGADKVLPFRFTAAARACPSLERELDAALCATIDALPRLAGTTVVMVDVSGSMNDPLSAKSDLTRKDAAATLASILNCDALRVFTFADRVDEVPPRRGMAGVDAIRRMPTGGTRLFDAIAEVQAKVKCDRLICITDEQATGNDVRFGHYLTGTLRTMPAPTMAHAYVINVASAKNGVGYGRWTHIDGFSESVIRWIVEHEAQGGCDV